MEKLYQSYYTKSDPIVDYMVRMLAVKPKMKVFEPCAGDGVFIDALNSAVEDIDLDIYDLNPKAISILKQKYGAYTNIHIKKRDTLMCPDLLLAANSGGRYDRIIANPPYGAWQDYEKRNILKKLYAGLYVKETYAIFLFRCTQLLRENGMLVFIIPDTFLNLHMHTRLREYLLSNTKIKEIALFPSSFFPGVNFGYSNLSIITLQRSSNIKECLANKIRVITSFREMEELTHRGGKAFETYLFLQKNVYNNIDHALFVSDNPKITLLINSCEQRIGDIAECVTGFYSGNDKKYLRYGSREAKNASKYEEVDKNKICKHIAGDIIDGIRSNHCFIPIVKGGGIRYLKPKRWYMDWSIKSVQEYKKSEKARFQNFEYYFKTGIGIPMVSSTQITAALIENELFDQSIVGLFPKEDKWTYYLLAFFNSPTCNKLIRTINPSANNSANYIKKIPFIQPSKSQLSKINASVMRILTSLRKNGNYILEDEQEINSIIQDIYGF